MYRVLKPSHSERIQLEELRDQWWDLVPAAQLSDAHRDYS
jgi:hypothetical protein